VLKSTLSGKLLTHFAIGCVARGATGGSSHNDKTSVARFSKHFTTNLWKTYEKVWLKKNLGCACDYQKILQKSYEKRRTKLCKIKTTILQLSYENVKFAASDVIRETLWHWSNTLS